MFWWWFLMEVNITPQMLLKTTRIFHLTPFHAERCTFTIVLQIRHSTWILSVSASLWTLTLWSCPLARFLVLARKTSASLLCCSLYLMSKCPLEQRAFDFSTGFYMVKSHRLTTVHIWDKQKHQHATEECVSGTTKLHLKRINILSSVKQNWCWNKLKN